MLMATSTDTAPLPKLQQSRVSSLACTECTDRRDSIHTLLISVAAERLDARLLDSIGAGVVDRALPPSKVGGCISVISATLDP